MWLIHQGLITLENQLRPRHKDECRLKWCSMSTAYQVATNQVQHAVSPLACWQHKGPPELCVSPQVSAAHSHQC